VYPDTTVLFYIILSINGLDNLTAFMTRKRMNSVKDLFYSVHETPFGLRCLYSETSIHRFRQGSEKETMDPGKQ
jgi:hypothetical protein